MPNYKYERDGMHACLVVVVCLTVTVVLRYGINVVTWNKMTSGLAVIYH